VKHAVAVVDALLPVEWKPVASTHKGEPRPELSLLIKRFETREANRLAFLADPGSAVDTDSIPGDYFGIGSNLRSLPPCRMLSLSQMSPNVLATFKEDELHERLDAEPSR